MRHLISVIGMFAGSCTTFSFLPQVLKSWKAKATGDISLNMYIVFCVGLCFWLLYGFLINDIPLVIANLLTLAMACSILFMKIKWK